MVNHAKNSINGKFFRIRNKRARLFVEWNNFIYLHMKKSLFFYGIIISIFAVSVWAIVKQGEQLPVKQNAAQALSTTVKETPVVKVHEASSAFSEISTQLLHNVKHPLSLLLMQIIVIILVSKLFGKLLNLLGQPTVVGEIIAGIFLGRIRCWIVFS